MNNLILSSTLVLCGLLGFLFGFLTAIKGSFILFKKKKHQFENSQKFKPSLDMNILTYELEKHESSKKYKTKGGSL